MRPCLVDVGDADSADRRFGSLCCRDWSCSLVLLAHFRLSYSQSESLLICETRLCIKSTPGLEMAINFRSAKELGISVPPTPIERADQIIEQTATSILVVGDMSRAPQIVCLKFRPTDFGPCRLGFGRRFAWAIRNLAGPVTGMPQPQVFVASAFSRPLQAIFSG